MGPAAGRTSRAGGDIPSCTDPRALPGAVRNDLGNQRDARGGADRTSSSKRDAVGPHLQQQRPRCGDLPAHRRPPPLCREIEAALGGVMEQAQQAAAQPPSNDRVPPPRWTLRRLVQWVEQRFGRLFCRETLRRALQRLKLSWKKTKKLLGRADPARRQAFLEPLEPLLDAAAR